ncbi:DUF4148 domain-containing protein [Paraburkholderia sp. J12]|uniref:DUF4148 domain-containing protein n=1 Tax=Paraburkholderia sp. J12 TaxID=2805432 RepID=UPI002ABD1F6E|nr:DUF4148 domain-containing protein [Paraburkholderia sp. J12]
MKSLIKAVALAAVLAVPAVSFAQAQSSNGPVTREQVRNELIQLEQAGYHPEANDRYYPEDIQAAQARVDAQNGVQTSGYGAATAGSSQSGGPSDGAVSTYSPPLRIYNPH